MKTKMMVIAMMIVSAAFLTSLAGAATKGQGHGPGGCQNITDGVPFSYEGTVITMGIPGQGMVLATTTENVTIFGIGPIFYWELMGVERPAVGDFLAVTGYTIECNGVYRNIAMNITIDGILVQLRDAETGRPLWRQIHNGAQE